MKDETGIGTDRETVEPEIKKDEMTVDGMIEETMNEIEIEMEETGETGMEAGIDRANVKIPGERIPKGVQGQGMVCRRISHYVGE